MGRGSYKTALTCIVLGMLCTACATSTPERSSVIKTLRNSDGSGPYANVLVVSAAGDRAARSRFEQALAEAIVTEDTAATAFFTVVGRYSPISRNVLNNAVRTREFDAILLVRRQGQERAELAPNRPTGRLFDLYHYDYDELNDLVPLDVDSTVSFVAELYDTAGARKIWAIESLLFESASAEAAVSTQAAIIARELGKDRLFSH